MLDSRGESLILPACLVEAHQRLHVIASQRPPISARSEGGQNLLSARLLIGAGLRTAYKQSAASRRSSVFSRLVGTADRNDFHRRVAVIVFVGRTCEPSLRRLKNAFGLPETADEGDPDFMLTRSHGEASLEPFIRCVHIDFKFGIALGVTSV